MAHSITLPCREERGENGLPHRKWRKTQFSDEQQSGILENENRKDSDYIVAEIQNSVPYHTLHILFETFNLIYFDPVVNGVGSSVSESQDVRAYLYFSAFDRRNCSLQVKGMPVSIIPGEKGV